MSTVNQVKSPTSLRRPQKSQQSPVSGLKPPQTQNPGLLSPRPYRTPTNQNERKLKPPPSYQKSPPVQVSSAYPYYFINDSNSSSSEQSNHLPKVNVKPNGQNQNVGNNSNNNPNNVECSIRLVFAFYFN